MMPSTTHVDNLLSRFVDCLNEHGPASPEAQSFLAEYARDETIAPLLRKALEVHEVVRSLGDLAAASPAELP